MPDDLPNLPILEPLKSGKRPFLGKRVANIVRAVVNALMHAEIVLGPPVPTGLSGASSTGGFASSPQGKVTWSKEKVVFTVPANFVGGGSSSSYRGEYSQTGATTFNSGAPYSFGDEVRVSPTNSVATTMGGTVLPGLYVCIQAFTPSIGTNLPNHFLSPGGETAFWQTKSTFPSTAQTCDGSGSTITVAVDQQKLS